MNRLNEGFYSFGAVSKQDRNFLDFLERKNSSEIEDFPWVFIHNTKAIGLGAFAAVDIPKGTICGVYS